MSVHQPGRVLLHEIPLSFVRKRVSGGGRKASDASIALIPFIDFLIVLTVFLLISFSDSELAWDKTLQVPEAANTASLDFAPIIAINPDVVMLDGLRIADTRTLAANAQMDRIDNLVQNLETLKRNWSILHPTEPFAGTVILQADKKTDFRVVKKIMFSTAQAGYTNISFAVNRLSAQGS